jgi:oligopeptide transport system substrate-binding protein
MGFEAHKKIAVYIASLWKKALGIDVSLQQMEWNAYLEAQTQLQYDVSRAGWIGDYADPNTFLDMFITDGANNQTGWSNAEYDRIIKELAPQESDPAKRLELLQKAERILMDDLPIIPIYYSVSMGMVRPYVKGFYFNIQDVHPVQYMSVDPDERKRFWEDQ